MKHLVASILLLSSVCVFAQNSNPGGQPDYPQDYFRNPLDIPIFLAGNFGECRPGHFHSGVDIKTLGKENQPVHAAADGYISRIKMDKTGFGHGLYITHPNGYTTLYAHLNDFAPAIQRYLKKEQYEKKHWDIDIQLTPDQFPVKKGQLIAWSGNTGASTAPHLHFEIRNTKTEHPLNPELFGLPIIDKTPPLPAEVVIYGRDVIGEGFYHTNRYTFKVLKKDKTYQLADDIDTGAPFSYGLIRDTIILEDQDIGVGINVDDHMDGSDNTLAFYTAQLYLDDSLQVEIKLDDIGYDLSRYVNAYADYKIKEQNNKWVQCLFKLPGNHLDQIYSYLNSKEGKLNWAGMAAHKVSIIITDDRGNQSEVLFYLKAGMGRSNYVQSSAKMFFLPNRINTYNGDDMHFSLSGNALYDRVPFTPETTKFDSGYSDKHKVLEPYIPVHSYFDLQIKPNKYVSPLLTNKIVMMYSDDKDIDIDIDGRAAAITDSGWYSAKVRNFGTYWLDIDTTPPTIKSDQKNGANLSKTKQITFEVKDNKTSVKKFNGYLDGKWICFEQHNDLFFYKFDEHCPKGKHQLVFTAEDENGNSSDYHLAFTR